MRMKAKLFFIMLLAMASARAEPPWTLERLLHAAWSSHPAVLGKRAHWQAAQADWEGARWQRYPTPSIEAAALDDGNTSVLARLQQPLWTGGRISAGIEAAARRADAAEASVAEARQEIGLRLIAAYVEALRQKARLAAAVDSVNEHERLLRLIERRVERGVSPPADRDLAQSRLMQAANELSSTKQALDNALIQLTQMTGTNITDVAEQPTENGAPAGRETALEKALRHSPSLRRLAFEEAAAAEDIALKRSALMPQLALRLEHGKATGGARSTDSRVMLVLEAQPGAGLSALSGVDAAVARREAAHRSREAALREVRERIDMDWNELVAARLRLENARQALQTSNAVFESYTRQYAAGRKGWIDVLNAVREAVLARYAVADAAAQATGAGARLQLISGELDEYGKDRR
jgi:adhesin transport system outer membrane protein